MSTLIFDLDDTLIHTGCFYSLIQMNAFSHIQNHLAHVAEDPHAFGLDTLNEKFQAIERESIAQLGFRKERFPLALAKLYEQLCEEHKVEMCHRRRHQIEGTGWSIYDVKHDVRPNVEETLEALHKRGHQMVLCTKGDQQIQLDKFYRTGLSQWFHHARVVPDKTIQTYLDLAHEFDLTPSDCWVIGDSIKSDVNPSAHAGFNAVWVRPPDPSRVWFYEVEEITTRHTPIDDMLELLALLPLPQTT